MYKKYLKMLNTLGYWVVFGIEREFYINEIDNLNECNSSYCVDSTIIGELEYKLGNIVSFEKERGHNQYEFKTNPYNDTEKLIECVNNTSISIEKFLLSKKLGVTFCSMPYENQPGSAMHVHVNLVDKFGCNVFVKNGDCESEIMQYAIGGLCAKMLETLDIISPNDRSYKRYNCVDMETPTNVSWGKDNRTTSIRIPSSATDPLSRRLEYRVAGADVDIGALIGIILYGIYYGIVNRVAPPECIYGIASDKQYDLKILSSDRLA